MIDQGYLLIVAIFLLYYFLVLIKEKVLMEDPREIIDKFLSILLLYAGISIVYFSLTGKNFLSNTEESYSVYLFIIGFIAILWTVPNLLKEFAFFRRFLNNGRKKGRKP